MKNFTELFPIVCMLLLAVAIQAQGQKKGAKTAAAPASPYQTAIDNAYAKVKDLKEGKNADYIKELANVDPNIYGIALVTVDGQVFTKGDLDSRVSIQSISKVFTAAKVIEEQGAKAVMDKIGVDATGLRFNSIVAIELQKGKEINPLVNPGAIAATSLIAGADSAAKWKNVLQTHNDFAGATLKLNMPVYISEAGDNLRNQAIAHLLFAYGRMYFDPVQSTDIYTKQCAINVNAKDLAVMAATLANGGANPVTKKKVVSPETSAFTLSIMATAGLYDDSGQWLYAVGLPGKSGVGGGIIAVCPGKFGIAVISPPLNVVGNSVKAQRTIYEIVKELKVNPYLVEPETLIHYLLKLIALKRSYITAWILIVMAVAMGTMAAWGQVITEIDTASVDPNSTVFENASRGEFTPGKGFQIVKNKFASLNFSVYAMARYVNQMTSTDGKLSGTGPWEDHLGNVRTFDGRQDFYWHRTMLWFTGYLGTPKLTYMATVWTVFTTQQTLVYGNIGYTFSKRARIAMGITPNYCIRSLQGPFPFFTSTDRTMAEDAIRGGFTNGLFLTGELLPGLKYGAALGNNLSQLGIKADKLTRSLSKSISLSWMPTTHEFGPRGGNGDFEHHDKIATRFGASFVHSRENRFNNTGTPSPDNTQVRMSDGVLFFETGALAPGVTVEEADFNLTAVDIGFKYKGFALHTEFYYRTLSDFDADGATPLTKITDKGFTAQILHMIVPRKVCAYVLTSGLIDEFGRNPYEVGGGLNVYPYKTRSWRLNMQALYVYKSAAGGTFGLYTAGQTGVNLTFGTDILL